MAVTHSYRLSILPIFTVLIYLCFICYCQVGLSTVSDTTSEILLRKLQVSTVFLITLVELIDQLQLYRVRVFTTRHLFYSGLASQVCRTGHAHIVVYFHRSSHFAIND